MIEQSIAIAAPIQSIYDVIVDFESYPEFLTETKEVKIHWCEDHQMDVTFHLTLIRDITYTLRFTLDPPHSVQWVLKSGDLMKKNTGFWKLTAVEPKLTDASYALDVAFGLWVPKAITESLVSKSLPDTLKKFKKRVEGMKKGR